MCVLIGDAARYGPPIRHFSKDLSTLIVKGVREMFLLRFKAKLGTKNGFERFSI